MMADGQSLSDRASDPSKDDLLAEVAALRQRVAGADPLIRVRVYE